MITLESLQVFPIEDGASGLVLATWAERSSVQGVPLRQHSILISSEEAQLLAQELNRVTDVDVSVKSRSLARVSANVIVGGTPRLLGNPLQ